MTSINKERSFLTRARNAAERRLSEFACDFPGELARYMDAMPMLVLNVPITVLMVMAMGIDPTLAWYLYRIAAAITLNRLTD